MAGYIKKCPECGSINLILNKDRGEMICRDCGLVVEERMVDLGQEWTEFDSDQAAKRRRTGAPMSYSVDYDEPVVIKSENKIQIVKIGKFVDELMAEKNSYLKKDGIIEYVPVEGFECVSFDGDYNIDFRKISEVSRHPADEVYEILLESGKKVRVTGSHSVFTVKDNQVVGVRVDKLKEGQFLVAPKEIPLIENVREINILDKKNWKFGKRVRIKRGLAVKIANKYHDNKLLKLAKAPFLYLRVRGIRKVKSVSGYAYDLTVPGYENFVGGRGNIFLHNTKFDRGLGTDIGQKADIYQLGSKERNKFFRLRKWQYRISTAIERNLKLALAELKRVASFLKLPKSVEEESARVYTMAVQRGLVRGRSMESVVAGALYAACRRHEVPRTLDELSEASGIDKKEIGRTYRFVTRELGMRILPSNPVDFIPRFASNLRLSPETQSTAVEILEKAQDAELTSGRGPTGIAAASLYVAALMNNEKRTQREVADVAGITEVTIRNRYKELLKKLNLKDKLKKKTGK
ncbi:hypothetical protein HY498_00430 [Candidatus Woesearchaeota archaeon]|nr:hypothetical protein [Candidatus Woesearchaeota archaeon]